MVRVKIIDAKFVFLGAGVFFGGGPRFNLYFTKGGSIKKSKVLAAFLVSVKWLVCEKPELV